jgi:hypothetical protein
MNRDGYFTLIIKPMSLCVLQHAKGRPVTAIDNTPPEYARVADVTRRYGLSRSRLYLLAGEGVIRFVKVGNATLVDLATVRAYMASCPPAQIRAPKVA